MEKGLKKKVKKKGSRHSPHGTKHKGTKNQNKILGRKIKKEKN